MMAKLGFKPGQSLGKATSDESTTATADKNKPGQQQQPPTNQHRSEPLNLIFKEDRGGIGLDNEKKRKIREEAEEATKKIKQDEGTYRDRVREERELRRTEAQFRAAQKVTERLDAEEESKPNPDNKQQQQDQDQDQDQDQETDNKDNNPSPPKQNQNQKYKLTSQINILYRGLISEREEKDRTNLARHTLHSSLPSSFFPKARLPGFSESEFEFSRDDRTALGQRDHDHDHDQGHELEHQLEDDLEPYTAAVEQEIEEEDPELDAFNELPASERLMKIVLYLREKYRYCFWCKYRYENDEEFEGCPGLTEEDHD